MADKILDSKLYEYIVFQHDPNREMMLKALDIVKDFIVDNNLIITGGMSVDFALRLKGEKLYDDFILPDYDFFSPEHHNHAYELGSILCSKLKDHQGDAPNISVIDALHITTMRVRVNFVAVADITYLPIEVFNKLPTMEYPYQGKKMRFRHPHLQMVDQHRALSMPYENAPREVILHRWEKDMKRFDLLYKHYPIIGKAIDDSQYQDINLDLNIIKNSCICGFAGLYIHTHNNKISLKTVSDMPLVLLSDNIEHIVSTIMDSNKISSVKYYNPYLDILPQKMVLKLESGVNIHIYDTSHKLISAEKIDDSNNLWLADAQFILAYFNIMQFNETKSELIEKYKDGYHTLAHLVESGIKRPTYITYGSLNIGIDHVLQRAQILSVNKEIPRIKITLKPGRFYPTEDKECKIPSTLNNFQYDESPLFHIDGEEVEKRPIRLIDFINPNLFTGYDSSSGSDNENN